MGSSCADPYGFQESFDSEEAKMLYLTSRLLDVYILTSPAEELKISQWKEFLSTDFDLIPRVS